MKQLSIKDIAKLAGVVPSTVSFVVNGKEKEMRISEEKASMIRKIIEETGYVPNKSAVSLRTGKTHVIGLIVEDISNAFFSLLAKAVEDFAYKVGYRVLYCSTENDDRKGAELVKLLDKQVDGFIITPTAGMSDVIRNLKKSRKPVVLLDRYFEDVDVPSVLVDNKGSIEKGVELLLNKKYKSIAFIITALDQVQMRERLSAFQTSIKKNRKSKESVILKLPFSTTEGAYETEIKKFLEKHPNIDAIFFATNYLSIEGLKVLQDLKWSIPKRIAVLSFDDHAIFKLYSPSITVINQPIIQIAKQGVEILTAQLNREVDKKVTEPLRLTAELIIRKSV